jgi:hypothetical protein
MGRDAAPKEGALALAARPVEILLGHGQVAGLDLQRQAAHGGKAQQQGRAGLLEGKHVGAVIHLVRQQAVPGAVAGQKQHLVLPIAAVQDVARGVAKRRAALDAAGDL